MRKETLLNNKKAIVEKMPWYIKDILNLNEEYIKHFSINQLEIMVEFFKKAEDFREDCDPFYGLSALEVLHKPSGRIAVFEKEITEEKQEECMEGASRGILQAYLNKKR